ncbi:hypothetical protein [Frankia sp. CIT1]|uniref:hypothetical protein n=1 Tax=Frankia sp. CIT1 TaxID=2880974 RepID=UPI001EF4381E|nr:hypothetical protein [Frankia sp. CIT1]
MIDAEAMHIPGWRGGDGNGAYLDKTLRHHPIELSLDDSVGVQVIVMLFARALSAAFLGWLVFAFLGLFATVGGGAGSGVGIMGVGAVIAGVVFWAVLLLSRFTEPIAEWRVLLEDRTDSVESTYSKIAGALRDRQIPLYRTVRRMSTGIGAGHVSNRLVLTEESYSAYVSVFSYGTSLYLGWMMWRSRRGYILIGKYLVDLVNGMIGRLDPETIMLRTERPRAMREAVHAACREGLYVAIEGRDVPITYGFPQGLPRIDADPTPPAPMAPPAGFGGPPVAEPPYQAMDQRQGQPSQQNWPYDGTAQSPPPYQQPPSYPPAAGPGGRDWRIGDEPRYQQ